MRCHGWTNHSGDWQLRTIWIIVKKKKWYQFTATKSQCFNHGQPCALWRLISTVVDLPSAPVFVLLFANAHVLLSTFMLFQRAWIILPTLVLFSLGLKVSWTIFKQEIRLPGLTTVSTVWKRVENNEITWDARTTKANSNDNSSERSLGSECCLSQRLRQMRNFGKCLYKENVKDNLPVSESE